MKKYLGILFMLVLLVPAISFGQTYSSTVSRVISNPIIKKYTPPTKEAAQDNAPSASLGKKKGYDPLIALLQAKLTNLGTDPGPVDGVNGLKTKKALKEVQQFFGLTADGVYGKEAQKLFAVLPINSSLRSTDPVVRIALKKYVSAQLAGTDTSTNTNTEVKNPVKLATIPFTPKGIGDVLKKSLASVGFTQVSEGLVSGKKVTAKPKVTSSGTKVALYTISPGGVSRLVGDSSLNTNFSSASGDATGVYVCGTVQNTAICVPVSFEVADAINKGILTLEQYLASKSANGDVCIQCFLDDNGNMGVITGGNSSGPIIPTGPTQPAAANVTSMCMDYPVRGTGNVAYQVTFDKPVQVVSSSGLSLEVVRYYNAPSKKITATYAGSPDGTVSGKTIRFTVPAGQLNSIYYEGEGTLKASGSAQIKVTATGEVVDLGLLPDVFRLSDNCTNSAATYDVLTTSVDLSPSQLYGGEKFDAPRLNVNVKFDEPVTTTGTVKLLMNPSNSGSTATGTLVSSKSSATDTLVFHFSLAAGSSWDNILGTFMFDPNSGTVKGTSGATKLLNIAAGEDSTGNLCATKHIGQPCLDLSGGEAKYTVYFHRKIEVTNGGNNSIRLKVEPLNPSAPDVIANLTSYDAHHLYFKAPATTNLVSDYSGHYFLLVDNPPSRVRTINGTLDSLGHPEYGDDAESDMGISGDTCSESSGPTATDICMNSNGEISNSYRVTFSEPVTVVGTPELKIQKNSTAPIVTAIYDGYDNADHTILKFTAQIGAGPNAGIGGQYYEGVGTISLGSGVSIKSTNGQDAPTSVGTFNFDDKCVVPPSPLGLCMYYRNDPYGNPTNGFAYYRVVYSNPVTVTGTPTMTIKKSPNSPIVTATYVGYDDLDHTTIRFVAPMDDAPNAGISSENFEGVGTIVLSGGSSIKDNNNLNAPLNVGTFSFDQECSIPEISMVTSVASECRGDSPLIWPRKDVTLKITYDKPVSVTGAPKLQIQGIQNPLLLPYIGLSNGNKTLTFRYVAPEQNDPYAFPSAYIGNGMFKILLSGASINVEGTNTSADTSALFSLPDSGPCPYTE